MNTYEKRHAVLARHLGKHITPAQLKKEVLRTFSDTNPSSVNAADCFYTDRKAAGCTCKECTNLGGFAVNKYGIVDMGASGFGEISPAYVPTGNVRNTTHRPRTDSAPMCAGVPGPDGVLRINPNDAVQFVREYNRSYYRGRSNTALDREAYRYFKDGVSRDIGGPVDQIAFVGEEYGGAQERFGSIRKEAELIAGKLQQVVDEWTKLVTAAKPLSQQVPDQETLDSLFAPFVGTKQWPVWASKTLHFLRPDVFPILDSNAKKPLGLKNLANSSRGYFSFSSVFRSALLANSEALGAARAADNGESPTDLKLLDKILFQLGLLMD